MKKLKYLLFFLPFCFSLNVFAQNVTSSIRCSYNGSGSTYYGDPNDGLNIARCYDTGTRYTPRLGYIEFFLPTSVMSFTAGKSYTVTMNMATNDWRNNIMLQSVRYVNSSGNVITSSPLPSMSNFRFISRKQIKFDFKLPSGTIYPYLRFIISSPTYANPDPDISSSTYMTGDSNWNLSSIDISPVSSSSGGSTGSTPTPTPSAGNQDIINNSNQNTEDIMNNNNQNTTDIINNSNQNTQDIIDNQNKNQEQTNQLLGQCFTNIYNFSYINNLYNFLNNNGVFIQQQADSASSSTLKLQFFYNGNYLTASTYRPTLAVGRFKFDFTKNSTFNSISFGVNGAQIDTLINYDVSYLKNDHDYSLIFDITNATQGSITLEKIMITDKVTYLLPYIPYNETICNSKLDTVGQSVIDGAQSIIGNNNQNTQSVIDSVNAGANALTDKIKEQTDTQKVCEELYIDNTYIKENNRYLISNGTTISSNAWGITDYIAVSKMNVIGRTGNSPSTCFYKYDKTLISCITNNELPLGNYTLPNDTYYFRASINISSNSPRFNILSCKYGNHAINDSLNDLNDNITDSNVDNGVGEGFFDNFTSQDFGLSQIITIPLNTIQSLTSKSCVPLQVPIPFTNSNVSLPCMTEIYDTKFPSIYNLWKIVSFGIIAYLIAIDIFHIVKGFKDPESDKVEVLDL